VSHGPLRRDAAGEYLRGALWALPTVAVVLALIAGSVLALVDIAPDSAFHPLVFQGTADDARTLLIGIASTMVTVIALVLGLTVVALQLASTQFSPRLLRNFLRDRVNQVVLSVFVATFTYSTAGLYTVGVSGGQRTSDFPRLAVTGALVLLFASLVMLVFFVHHLVHSIQVDEIMSTVERNTLHVIERDLPTAGITAGPLPDPPVWAVALPSHRSGYLQTVHPDVLLAAAVASDVNVAVTSMVGDHVVAGSPLVWLWRPSPEQPPPPRAEFEHVVRDAVRIGFERTMEQDAAFGVRQLADIASKALSPAINDPYTAVQALQHIAVVLAELSHRPLGSQVLRDSSGAPRVTIPGRDFAYYVDLACGQIRRYGRSEPRVMLALLRILRSTARFCPDDSTRAVLARQVRLVLADAEAAIVQPADLEPVQLDAAKILREVSG
jgi:uncharacterized membrane protein